MVCESALAPMGSSVDLPLAVCAEEPSPSELTIAREQAEALERALDRLPTDYCQVIRWRYQDELPFEEIGRLMNRTGNAVEKLWPRAIERLRQDLEKPA